jgi:hypothetical protein
MAGSRRPPEARMQSASDQMSALIERAALSVDVDLAKLDRLLAHQERIYRDKARAAFDGAYANLQLALPIIAENGEILDKVGVVQHTYPLWEDINELVKPLLSEHGFALWFKIDNDGRGVNVTGVLSHLGGHFEETTIKLPADLTGGKTSVQAIGSSTSYGKRYVAAALLNLTSRGEDDDGTATPNDPTISAEQVADLLTLLEETGASEERLLSYLDLTSLDDLTVSRLERTIAAIRLRGNQS